jgi:ankyrin repeat protein
MSISFFAKKHKFFYYLRAIINVKLNNTLQNLHKFICILCHMILKALFEQNADFLKCQHFYRFERNLAIFLNYFFLFLLVSNVSVGGGTEEPRLRPS